MIDSVLERLLGFLRQIQIAAHIGILKAQLADLTVLDLVAVLTDQGDLGLDLRLTDGTGLIRLIDREYAYREAAFGRRVDIDQLHIGIIKVVRRFTADYQHAQEGTGGIAEHANIRRRQEGDADALFKEIGLQREGVLDGRVTDDKELGALDAEQLQNKDDGGDKVHRREQRNTLLAGEGILTAYADRFDRAAEVAVFVQHALGIACRTGGVDRVCRVMQIGLFVSRQRITFHDIVPIVGI